MSENSIYDVTVFTHRNAEEEVKTCKFQMTHECVMRLGTILDDTNTSKLFTSFETTEGFFTFPSHDICGIEYKRIEKEKSQIELIRKKDVFQNFNLKPVSQIAADALFAAGVKGAFTVTVDMGIAQKYEIAGEERTVYTDTFHAPSKANLMETVYSELAVS